MCSDYTEAVSQNFAKACSAAEFAMVLRNSDYASGLTAQGVWIIWNKTMLTTASFLNSYTNICKTAQAARQATGKKLNRGVLHGQHPFGP